MSTNDNLRIEEGRDDLPFQIHWELDDAPLTVDAFRVYAHLVRCAGKNGLIFPSYLSIGEKCFRVSVGLTAHPRSLRNRAMKAMKELVDVGLVIKQTRNKRESSENDSNIYTLTPRRQWVDDLRTRGEALKAAVKEAKLEKHSAAERETGGIPTVPPPSIQGMPPGMVAMPPPGIQGMPRGMVSMPEVSSTEVLQSFEVPSTEAAAITLEDNARATEVPDAAADSPVGLTPQAMPATLEVSEALPFSVTEAQVQAGDVNPKGTSTEHVPGGAAGGYAILGLTPVPRPVLEARRAQDPEHMPRLRALLNASPRSRLAHLNAVLESATQTGGIPRELLTRLTDEELALVAKAAKADAHHPGGFMKFGALALDRMIGAPITREIIEGKRPAREQTLGHAYEVKNEPKVAGREASVPQEPVSEPQDLLRKYRGLWCLRKNPDKVVDVVDVEERPGSTALLYLNDESTLTVATLMLQYQRPAWMQHDASA